MRRSASSSPTTMSSPACAACRARPRKLPRPRGGHLDHLPAHHHAGNGHCPPFRRAAGLCALLRRGHRDRVHGRGRHADDPALGPVRHAAADPVAGRQRCRAHPRPALRHPRVPRPAHRLRRRGWGSGLTRSGHTRGLPSRGTLAPRPATERRISRGVTVTVSATIRSTAGVSVWRVAVIGFVGVLAVGIGVAAGSFLLTTRAAAVGSGAAYVPADAPFYFEMRLEPSAAQDQALRGVLAHFPPIEGVDLDQALYAQMTEKVDEMLAAEGAGVSWASDVAPWFDGHVAMALTDFPLDAMDVPADPMAMPEVPPFVVLLGVTDATAAAGAIDRILAEAGADAPTFTESQHLGFTIRSSDGPDGGAYALSDDQLVVASDADGVRAALDTHASGAGTLAEMAEITRLTDALPEDWLAFVSYDMTDLMAQAFSQAEDQEPEMAAAFES